MVTGVWRKSILFELIDRNVPGTPVDALALIIPPDSVQISIPQRVYRVKTFAGVFEEDYGSDIAKITITGNTGGSQIREVFCGERPTEQMTGKEAIYALRDRIFGYKERYPNAQNIELRMYDLSSVDPPSEYVGYDFPVDILKRASENWIVSIDSFQISRSKDRPLFYEYTIELVGIRRLGVGFPQKPQVLPKPTVSGLRKTLKTIQETLNDVKTKFAQIRTIANSVYDLIEVVNTLGEEFESFVSQAGEIIRFPAKTALQAISLAKEIIIKTDPDYLEETFADYWSLFKNDWIKAGQAMCDVGTALSYWVASGKSMSTSTLEKVGVVHKSSTVIEYMTGESESITTATVQGYTLYQVKEGDTFESIAKAKYNDPSYAWLIEKYNGLIDSTDLIPGYILKIPYLETVTNPDMGVYTFFPSDVYGTDIEIRTDGALNIGEFGDFYTVTGYKNIAQAIENRLNEVLGKRVFLTTYGIKSNVGTSMSNSSVLLYLATNIQETVLQDPRIERVTSIQLRGSGSSLYYTIGLDIKNSDLNTVTVSGVLYNG